MKVDRIYGGGTFVVHEGKWENDKERKISETVHVFEIVLVYEDGLVETRVPVCWVRNPEEMEVFCTKVIEINEFKSARLFVDLKSLLKGR